MAGVKSSEIAQVGTRPYRILRVLADSTEPVPTPQLIDLAGEGDGSDQRYQTWYGAILRQRERLGQVARQGWTEGGWQQGSAVTWSITAAGRKQLAEWEAAPVLAAEAAAREASETAEAERRAAVAATALESAVREFGNRPPPHVRRRFVRGLREAGCTLAAIGDAFGVTREQIRQDVINGPDYVPPPRGNGAQRTTTWRTPRRRALERLAAEHPERFAEILAEEESR